MRSDEFDIPISANPCGGRWQSHSPFCSLICVSQGQHHSLSKTSLSPLEKDTTVYISICRAVLSTVLSKIFPVPDSPGGVGASAHIRQLSFDTHTHTHTSPGLLPGIPQRAPPTGPLIWPLSSHTMLWPVWAWDADRLKDGRADLMPPRQFQRGLPAHGDDDRVRALVRDHSLWRR